MAAPVTDIRTDKVEQKSVSLSWQEPGFPTANGTEYEVKYYEKVGSGDWLQFLVMLQPSLANSQALPHQPGLPGGAGWAAGAVGAAGASASGHSQPPAV